MEKQQIEEVLRIVTDAMIDLETAKSDCKMKIGAAFEAYEFTPDQIKALMQVAKAKIKEGKMEELETATAELFAVIELIN